MCKKKIPHIKVYNNYYNFDQEESVLEILISRCEDGCDQKFTSAIL
jgi:hypothetical protein